MLDVVLNKDSLEDPLGNRPSVIWYAVRWFTTYLCFLDVRIKMCNSSVILKVMTHFFTSVIQRSIHHDNKHTECRSTMFSHCMASVGTKDKPGVIYPIVVFIGHVLMSFMLLFIWM
jgi:hypothetical protein